MPESHASRGTRRGQRSLVTLGEELRAARLSAGLSLTSVSSVSGVSPSELSRIERGRAPWLGIVVAARLAAVVGLDLVVRSYPGGEPIRDIAHVRLLQAFQARLHPTLHLATEVPIGPERDQRAWDATVEDDQARCAVELETRITDAQALIRRINLKLQDSRLDRVILVVTDTNTNRRAVAGARPLFETAFPMKPDHVLGAFRNGRVPEASGLVLLRVDRVRRRAVPRQQ